MADKRDGLELYQSIMMNGSKDIGEYKKVCNVLREGISNMDNTTRSPQKHQPSHVFTNLPRYVEHWNECDHASLNFFLPPLFLDPPVDHDSTERGKRYRKWVQIHGIWIHGVGE